MSAPPWLLSAIEQAGMNRVPIVHSSVNELCEQHESSTSLINRGVESVVPNVHNVPPLFKEDEEIIRKWLVRINETDPIMIEYVIRECRSDPEAKTQYLILAKEC